MSSKLEEQFLKEHSDQEEEEITIKLIEEFCDLYLLNGFEKLENYPILEKLNIIYGYGVVTICGFNKKKHKELLNFIQTQTYQNGEKYKIVFPFSKLEGFEDSFNIWFSVFP